MKFDVSFKYRPEAPDYRFWANVSAEGRYSKDFCGRSWEDVRRIQAYDVSTPHDPPDSFTREE